MKYVLTLSLAAESGVVSVVEFLSTFKIDASHSRRVVVNQNL